MKKFLFWISIILLTLIILITIINTTEYWQYASKTIDNISVIINYYIR